MTSLKRTLDASFLNTVANDPSVRPWLGGKGPIDLTPRVAHMGAIALVGAYGGFLIEPLAAGLYDVHSLFLPDGRGVGAAAAMQEGLEYIFTATDCTELVTKIPEPNRAARQLATVGGFRERFTRGQAWQASTGVTTDCAYWGLTLQRWMLRSGACQHAGEWFHEQVDAEKLARGASVGVHPDDAVHDYAAGFVVLAARAGQYGKAVDVYNRWAVVAGYQPIRIVSFAPVVLDTGDAVMEITGGSLEVLLCR